MSFSITITGSFFNWKEITAKKFEKERGMDRYKDRERNTEGKSELTFLMEVLHCCL